MAAPDLVLLLSDPRCFPGAAPVQVIQTHISIVCLSGDRAYKFKKPLRLPFLDFSTLALRRHFCREEVRLNRRLCPDVYLGTSALRRTAAGLRVQPVGDDDGIDDVDVAVVMRRLPQERMLDRLLAGGAVTAPTIEQLARTVAAFHAAADRGAAVRAAGDPDRLVALAVANFTELAALPSVPVAPCLLHALAGASAAAFARDTPALRARAARGRVVDGHGDLHARNVCLCEPVAIYDCIEFAAGFRCVDVATEVAFLAMDLRYRGAPALADAFVAAYAAASHDDELPGLLPTLCCYRAMVRTKVAALAAGEPDLSPTDRAGAAASAIDHAQLAAAALLDDSSRWRARWLALCGPPGSGKSTLAAQLRRGTAWPCVSTDLVRKELAGLQPTQRGAPAHYTPAFTARTYAELFARAAALTPAGGAAATRTVVLDGNFASPERRAEAARAAAAAGAAFAVVHVDVPAATGRQRVADRAGDPARVSDAGPAEHDALRRQFVPPAATEGHDLVAVDGAATPPAAAAQLLAALLDAAPPRRASPTRPA